MNFAKLALALSLVAAGTAAVAQPYGQADADRRAQNRADILANNPEARRMVRDPAMTPSTPASRDPVARVGGKAYDATTNFAERQKAKLRRAGKRIEANVPPKPASR